MPKRKASSYNAASGRRFAGASGGSRRAAAIGARLAARYPYSGFGRMYVPKGSFTAAAGESYRAANAEQRAWRKANNFSGVGGFWGNAWAGAKKFGKEHGGKVMGIAAAEYARSRGADANTAGMYGGAAQGLGNAFGLGRYTMGGVGSYGQVLNNALVHGGNPDSMAIANVNPTMSDDSGDVVMSHSEFIGNVVATASIPSGNGATVTVQSTFQNSIYAINPGLQGSFPFLCQLAQNYTMYKLEGCIYQYKPTSGEGGGATNQLGKIIMATDYDPMALPFINSVQMENYQYSQSTKPSLAARHGIECAISQGITEMKYVRTGTSNRDKSFTDYGLFQLATEGVPITGVQGTVASANIGELWVSYRVRLSRANLYSSLLGYNIRNDIFDYEIAASPASEGALVSTNLITTQNPNNANNIGTTIILRQGRISGTGISAYPDTLTVQFPVSQILGVYKITIFSGNAFAEAGYQAWTPLSPDVITPYVGAPAVNPIVPVINERTQWGCTFMPMRTGANTPANKPAVNLTTGYPIWQTSDPPRMFLTSAETTTLVKQSMSTTYFAINSPTTTVAQCTFALYSYATNAGSINGVIPSSFQGVNTFRIMIEQVNAEISN